MPTNSFTANELLTLAISLYAAVISTFVLGWDAYKWLASGPKIDVSASTNMTLIGGSGRRDGKLHISITATNTGDRPTTITNLGGKYYESWWAAYVTRRKAAKAFIVSQPSDGQRIPYRFEVGSEWIGMADQEGEIAKMCSSNGYLFFIVYTAGHSGGHRVRVKLGP